MTRFEERIRSEYFEWMVNLVCHDRFAKEISFRKLLAYLHNTEFTYSIRRDSNREADGKDLRYRFAITVSNCHDADLYLDGPCSVLEMMIALAIRCEESIMDDPRYGDRTDQWFWGMINSLGLSAMNDELFDEQYVESCVSRFLNRKYSPDGRGGLFTIRGCKRDLRKVEIWCQLCWYLDTFV